MSISWREGTAHLLLRIGVAFAFIYPAVSAYFNPFAWVGYFPGPVLDVAGGNDVILLHAFGILEIIIAVWILSGIRIIIPSIVATTMLAAIVALNLNQMDVLFRDIPIALMAVVLVISSWPSRAAESST